MGTLNQYAARVANMVNQPFNHELKERIKDMIKTVFANRIRQSVDKHGIDDILKLSFTAEINEVKYNDILPVEYRIANKIKLYGTINKVPTPVRINNDAPFSFVGNTNGEPYTYVNSITALKYRGSGRPTLPSIGCATSWLLINRHIIVVTNNEASSVKDLRNNSQIFVTGIFENPEQVLTMYNYLDSDDIELPLPNDMLESIIQEVLKTEFNFYQTDIDIQSNSTKPSIAETVKQN